MIRPRFHRDSQPVRRNRHSRRPPQYRRARFELLESRWVLSAPTLAAIPNVTLLAGAPLHIALDGFDADSDTLTYQVSSSNPAVTAHVPQGNRSLRISVANHGVMEFELFEDLTPRTTGRIIELAQSDFYDGLTFHRIINNFMIQGGDPLGTGTGGSGVDFDDEFHADLQHTSSGLLSMAKSHDDTNDSQFFITDGPTRHLDFNHTIFGFLTKGDAVRDQINSVATDGNDKPLTPVVMSAADVFTDNENGVLRLSAPAGTTGQSTITVTVSDGKGGTASQTFNVTVQADTSNAQPYLLPIDPVATAVNTPVTFSIPARDIENDAIHYEGMAYPENANLEVQVNPTTGSVLVTPKNGITGVHNIMVAVRAANGNAWDTQVVPVHISGGAPGVELLTSADTGVSTSDGITHLDNTAGKLLRFRVNGTVKDGVVTLYSGSTAIGTATAGGDSVIVETNGTFDLADGTHTITAKQVLGGQETGLGSLQIQIDTSVPAFTSNPVLGAGEGVQYVYDAQTNDEAAGGVRYQLTSAPAGMIVDLNTGRITWTPNPNQQGTHSVTLRASDLAGNTVDQSFQISVADGPEITAIPAKQVREGQTLSFTVFATDIQPPLAFSLEGAPAGATIDSQNGEFTWATTEAHGPGQYQITVKVANAAGAVSRALVTITVTEENSLPQLPAIQDVTINEGLLFALDAAATDTDLPANTLVYSLGAGAPAGAQIDPATGRFTWTATEAQGPGQYPITISVHDGAGGSDSKSFTITVREVDNPPVFNPVDVQTLAPGEPLRLTVFAEDRDIPNPNPVQYSLDAGAPEGATIDATTGELIWDIPENFPSGTIELIVRATEVTAASQTAASSSLTVTVVITSTISSADLEALAMELTRASLEVTTAALAEDSLVEDPVNDGTNLQIAGTFDDRGLLGTRFAVHGGMHLAQPNPTNRDRIDASGNPSPESGEAQSGDRIDDLSSSNPEHHPRRVAAEAADAAIESLLKETPPAETPAPNAEEVAAAVVERTGPQT